MPRYYFDIDDGELHCDEEGFECENFEAARDRVIASLPDLAELIISEVGDDQVVTVAVRDEQGNRIYTGTLTFAGSRLDDAAS